ncbi:MAG: hypothetical protein H7A00_07580 [Hahellaceae bacterium]|nr:hypothetical protein [Hahellaceae bacterium]
MLKSLSLSALLALSTFTSDLYAETIAGTPEVTKLSEQFMKKIQEGNTLGAYSSMTRFLGVDAGQFDQFGQTANDYMSKVHKQIGAPLSFDLLSSEAIKQHFYRQTYLLKYPQAALVWRLTYYNASQGWQLVGIDYSTDIEQLYKLAQ